MKNYKAAVLFLIIGLIVISLYVLWFIPFIIYNTTLLDYIKDCTGYAGDTIGGLTAPIIGLLSALLVYVAFKAQIEANEQQNKQFEIQQFEAKFFDLLKIHRENVHEMKIEETDYGRKNFVLLIREFRVIIEIVKTLFTELKLELIKERIFIVSYYILFFGKGINSSRQLRLALKDIGFDDDFFNKLEPKLENNIPENEKRNLKYKLFEGHQSRLGHYYRHLYQTVKFVDESKCLETLEEKYKYVKTLRAQLSTHEQALLFINCLTPIGRKWQGENKEGANKFQTVDSLLNSYRMVKNIPNNFFDDSKEIKITDYFPSDYFEWQDSTKVINKTFVISFPLSPNEIKEKIYLKLVERINKNHENKK